MRPFSFHNPGFMGNRAIPAFAQLGTVSVTERTGVAQTGLQVKVPVLYKSGLNSDFSNIQFKDTSNNIIPHWIDYSSVINNVSANVWIKVPSLSGSGVFNVVYGSNLNNNTSNGFNVFDFFDDFESGSFDLSKWTPYSTTDKTWAFVDNWRMETLFTATGTGNQGLAADGTNFFIGKDNGTGVPGTIYKYDYAGNLISTFTSTPPPHCNTLSLRPDRNTLLACSAGDTSLFLITELDKTTGALIRQWNFSALNPPFGPNACYYGPGNDASSFRALVQINGLVYKVLLNDNGTYVMETGYAQDTTVTRARMQSIFYKDGVLYYVVDDNTGTAATTTNYGQIIGHRLNDTSLTLEVVSQWQHLPGNEREGLTHDGTNWYYNAHEGTIRKLVISNTKAAIFNTQAATSLSVGAMSNLTFGAPSILFFRMWIDGNFPTIAFADLQASATNVIGFGHFDSTSTLKMRSAANGTGATGGVLAAATDFKNWHNYELKRQLTDYEATLDGTSLAHLTTNMPTIPLKIRLDAGTSTSAVGGTLGVEHIGVRKFVSIEPLVAVV